MDETLEDLLRLNPMVTFTVIVEADGHIVLTVWALSGMVEYVVKGDTVTRVGEADHGRG